MLPRPPDGPRGAARLACASFVLAHVASAAVGAQAPTAFAPAPVRGFWSARSPHVEMRGSAPADARDLLALAETTHERLCAWLGVSRVRPAGVVRVWIVDDPGLVRAIERRSGVAASAFANGTFRGRSHPQAGLVILPAWDERSLRWQLVHEIAHVVLAARTGSAPVVIDEGVAELAATWILESDARWPEDAEARYALYDRRLAQAVLARELPTVERLASVTRAEFDDPRAQWLWHAASWKLVTLLVQGRDPAVRGRFQGLLGEIAAARPLDEALRRTYDASELEGLWRRTIEDAAPWRGGFGAWTVGHASIVGRARAGSSACAHLATPLDEGEAFDVAYTLRAPPASTLAFGFVVEWRGPESFTYVEIVPSEGRLVLAERAGATWARVDSIPCSARFETARTATGASGAGWRVALAVDAAGRVEVRVDGELVARAELGRAPRAGSTGVLLEDRSPAAEGADSEVEFHAFDLLRHTRAPANAPDTTTPR